MVQKKQSRKMAQANFRAKRNRYKQAQVKPASNPRRLTNDRIAAAEFSGIFEQQPAEYDVDVVEARAAELVEQGWPPCLRPYAVGLAMGLNPLDDPKATQCESEMPEDFLKDERLFDDLVHCVGQEFSTLAKIPVGEQIEFSVDVSDALNNWMTQVAWNSKGSREFLNCLIQTQRDAVALSQSLKKLSQKIEEIDRAELSGRDYDGPSSDIFMRLCPSVIARILHNLPAIIEGTRSVLPTHEREGRPQGRREYPGLAELVFDLEWDARVAGGGFGTPNKKLMKGRLIRALDWLKATLADSNDWRWLAKFLPSPGQHPVKIYERALARTRRGKDYRIMDLRRAQTEAKVDDVDWAKVRQMREMARSMRYLETVPD